LEESMMERIGSPTLNEEVASLKGIEEQLKAIPMSPKPVRMKDNVVATLSPKDITHIMETKDSTIATENTRPDENNTALQLRFSQFQKRSADMDKSRTLTRSDSLSRTLLEEKKYLLQVLNNRLESADSFKEEMRSKAVTEGKMVSKPNEERLADLTQRLNAVPGERTKKVRCIFWPKCSKGESCLYHHPSEQCKNYPSCPYGDSCFFIHPSGTVCKYGIKCFRHDCYFKHPPNRVVPRKENKW